MSTLRSQGDPSLRDRAIAGAKWTTASTAAVTAIQFSQLTVVARLLSPADFGLMAMVMAVLGFAQIFTDMGIGGAIIHRQKNSPNELSSLFWLNVAAGAVVFFLLVSATPMVVAVFDEPRLGSLLPTMAVLFLISSYGQLFSFSCRRSCSSRCLRASNCPPLRPALLSQSAAQSKGSASTHWPSVSWPWPLSPRWARRRSAGGLAAHVPFPDTRHPAVPSIWTFQLGNRGVNFLVSRVDQVIVGTTLGASTLGLYNLAWNLAVMPATKINPILTRVAFPVFAKVQLDNERLKRGYLTLVWLLATTNGPILVGGAAVAGSLIPLVFGEQWAPMVPLFQVLAFVGLSRSIVNPVGALVLAKGQPDLEFKLNVWFLILQIPTVYLGVQIGGIAGVAWVVLALQLADLTLVYIFLMRPLIGPCLREYVSSVAVPLATTVAMAGVVMLVPRLMHGSPLLVLIIQIAIGAAFYIATTAALRRIKLIPLLDNLIVTRP